MIPDDLVEEVRARADLVGVIGESVALKRSGKDWKGKCPFHDDRTPSFYVVPDKGFYKCFGCGESGDIFAFVMKRTGMDFQDAVKSLGERFGVQIHEVAGGGRDRDDPFQTHYEANAFARSWFREQLLDPRAGGRARTYMEGRGIDAETAERFGLGWAPDEWHALGEAASKHGFSKDLLLEIGLSTTSERSTEPYDRFRGRLIFPIESLAGRVVGFGGRVLDGGGKGRPKYLNSPESPIYHKGEILYGLNWNRNAMRRAGCALVVEGYMDVVTLAAAGVGHAVATLGTAMTDEHARLLSRYAKKASLLFDSDEAGLRATFRAADALLAHGVQPSVVTFPPGEDPDTVVRAEGREGLEHYLDSAVDVLDRKLQLLDEKGYFGSIDRVRIAVDKLLPTLRATKDPALRDIYVSRVADRTGVRRETLEAEVDRSRRETVRRRGSQRGREGAPTEGGGFDGRSDRSGNRIRPNFSRLGVERQLLLILLRSREWVDRALERIGPEEFRDPKYRAIFEALIEHPDLESPTSGLPPDAAAALEQMLGDPQDVEHPQQALLDCLSVLEDRALQERQEALERDLRAAVSEEDKRQVLERLDELRRTRRGRWNVARRKAGLGIAEGEQRMNATNG